MSEIHFRMTAKGNLPQLSYILHNPEPLGTVFKTVEFSVTGALLFLEIYIGKEGINNTKYHLQLGLKSTCKNIMMEATKGIGHRYIKGATKDCFIFDSWLSSKKSAEDDMGVGSDMIGMFKTNTKGLCNGTIYNITKDWPGGYYLVLSSKHMVPGGRPIIAMGYNYNAQKVLYFIVAEDVGITKACITYL